MKLTKGDSVKNNIKPVKDVQCGESDSCDLSFERCVLRQDLKMESQCYGCLEGGSSRGGGQSG